MYKKLKYNPKTGKRYRPIIKFNGGRGAILCVKCRKILKEDLSIEEFLGKTDLLFCSDCALEVVKEFFNSKKTNDKDYEKRKKRSTNKF
jgi:hypothetical protein